MQAESLLRKAVEDFPQEEGKLWIFLADFFTRQGKFVDARQVYEEALSKLTSVRDFGIVYNAYLKFEEAMLEIASEDSQSEKEQESS
jgi:pre-mRNA-splicing factor SYF1